MIKRFTLFLLFLISLFCAACSSTNKTIRLIYQPTTDMTLPDTTAARIDVVTFTDKRGQYAIGETEKGESIEPMSDVSTWVTRAYTEELIRHGVRAVAASKQQSKNSTNPYILTGNIDKVWVTKSGVGTVNVVMQITTRLTRKGASPKVQIFTSQQQNKGLPTKELVEESLSNALTDILNNSIPMIISSIRK